MNLSAARDIGGTLQRLKLIFHDRLRVEEQSADQCGLSIVNAPARVETQDIHRGDTARGGRRNFWIEGSEIGVR
jgi:hypothetical protein